MDQPYLVACRDQRRFREPGNGACDKPWTQTHANRRCFLGMARERPRPVGSRFCVSAGPFTNTYSAESSHGGLDIAVFIAFEVHNDADARLVDRLGHMVLDNSALRPTGHPNLHRGTRYELLVLETVDCQTPYSYRFRPS
ncbi:MAG: hypothetical protein ACYCOU_10230 [Sulfobacillus sp.]